MTRDRARAVEQMLREAARLHETAARESAESVVAAVDVLKTAFDGGRKALIFGNGGSAADAQFDPVFARQIEALGNPAIAFTGGSGGPVGSAADVHVNVLVAVPNP